MENTQTPQQIINDFFGLSFGQYHPIIRTFIEDMGTLGKAQVS